MFLMRPLGVAPDAASWVWIPAVYQGDVDGFAFGDLARDEYVAALTVAQAGAYTTAYRFSVDGGLSWTYCDLDGSANGFQADQAGLLLVSP